MKTRKPKKDSQKKTKEVESIMINDRTYYGSPPRLKEEKKPKK